MKIAVDKWVGKRKEGNHWRKPPDETTGLEFN
jgi:hypothetical protein